MSTATFTPAQQALRDALAGVHTDNLHIARKVLEVAIDTDFGGNGNEPDPEDYGAPVNTPAWGVIEDAMDGYDKATRSLGEKAAALGGLDVINAVLAAKGA